MWQLTLTQSDFSSKIFLPIFQPNVCERVLQVLKVKKMTDTILLV